MIQYLNEKNKPICMSLEEALELQEKLSAAVSRYYKKRDNVVGFSHISLPITLADGDKYQASVLNIIIEEE